MTTHPEHERWFEYRCVECDPAHNPSYELEFVMLLPDNDDEVPDLCPRCGSVRSLALGNTREVVRAR